MFKVQNLLNEHKLANCDAKDAFIKGLIMVVNHKFSKDIPKLLQNRELFYHTVNEAISFQKTLQNLYSYSSEWDTVTTEVAITPLDVFLTSQPLEYWIEIERDRTLY